VADHYLVASKNILGIRTNVPDFKWTFGTTTPRAARADYEKCVVRLRLRVQRQVDVPRPSDAGKYHYFRGSAGRDATYYDRRFAFGARLQLAAEGLLGDEPSIIANQTYRRFVHHRLNNLHSLGYLMTDLAAFLLLRRGYAPLHCSAIQIGDATVVIAAAPNTGKTLSSIMACLDHGARFLAEDVAITDGETIYSAPWTSTFRFYPRIDPSLLSRLQARLTSWVSLFELVSVGKPKPITEYIAPENIVPRARITHVVILARGDRCVRTLRPEQAARQIRNLNRFEFNYHKAPLVVAHEFFNPALDIDGACNAERRILRKMVAGANHRLVVSAREPTEYASMIVDAVNDQREPPIVRDQAA